MKILMVSAAVLPFWKCGVATIVEQLRVELQNKGHEVSIFALYQPATAHKDKNLTIDGTSYYITRDMGMEKHFYSREGTAGARHVSQRFSECLREFQPDVVHFHTPQYFCMSLIKQAKYLGAKVIVTLHDWWWICPAQFFAPEPELRCTGPNQESCLKCVRKKGESNASYQEWKALVQEVEPLIDQFICVSKMLYYDVRLAKPWLEKKLVVIPNAVAPVADFPKREGPVSFAFLGGLSAIKGYNHVIEGFERVKTTNPWRLYIYGCVLIKRTGWGLIYSLLRNIKHPLNLAKKIYHRFVKKRAIAESPKPIFHLPPFEEHERSNVLNTIHVVIVCSQVQESFSLVAHEAMANGCCVVTGPCGGPSEVVVDGVNGILLKDTKPETLAKTLRTLIDHPEYRERLQRGAYVTAQNFLNPQQMTWQYLQVYNKGSKKNNAYL